MERFRVFTYDDAEKDGLPLPHTLDPYPYFSILYDFSTDPPTMVADDRMEPEDVSFYRNLAWVPKLLNELDERK